MVAVKGAESSFTTEDGSEAVFLHDPPQELRTEWLVTGDNGAQVCYVIDNEGWWTTSQAAGDIYSPYGSWRITAGAEGVPWDATDIARIQEARTSTLAG